MMNISTHADSDILSTSARRPRARWGLGALVAAAVLMLGIGCVAAPVDSEEGEVDSASSESSACLTDADCIIFANNVTCECVAAVVGTRPPKSDSACLVDPCLHQVAACRSSVCVAVDDGSGSAD